MMDPFLQIKNRLLGNLGQGRLIRINLDGVVIEHESSSLDSALAVIADALKHGVYRAEARLGEKFYDKTKEFQRRADQQDRAFVRDGSPLYALSISKTDLLDDQSRIYVQTYQHRHRHHVTGKKLSPLAKDREAKVALIEELSYAVKLARNSHELIGEETKCRG